MTMSIQNDSVKKQMFLRWTVSHLDLTERNGEVIGNRFPGIEEQVDQ
jgi:hypothetical protein